MISKICNSKLSVANSFKAEKSSGINKSATFNAEIPKTDYLLDFEKQKRNALKTSFAVVGSSLLFTVAYVFYSVIHNNRL